MAKIIRDRDRGYKALLKRLAGAPSQVTVGIHEDEGSQSPYANGASVAAVAAAHELGLGVPQRSFLAGWADENESKNRDKLRKIGAAVVKGKLKSQAQGLERFGLHAAGEIKIRIRGGISPGLDEATKKRRKSGSSTPLIDTGILWSAITVQVDGKKDSRTLARQAKSEARKTAKTKRQAQAARKRAFRKVTRATKKAAKRIVRRSGRTAARTTKRLVRKARKLL